MSTRGGTRQRTRTPRRRRRRRARRWARAAAWPLTLAGATGAVAVLFGPSTADAMTPSAAWWLLDVASTGASQALVLALVAGTLATCFRLWASASVCVLSTLVLILAILGVERAPLDADADGPRIRVLAVNAYSSSDAGPEQLEALLASGADIIALAEPSRALLEAVRTDTRVREAYPYFRLPDRAGPGFRFVLSRYALRRGDDGFGFAWDGLREAFGYHGTRVLRVETDAGPFVFVSVQLRSPRSAERWAAGNEQAVAVARGVSAVREQTGLPVIVAGDFNASPTGWRPRMVAREAGLAHAKPVFRAAGTWPQALPWPARSAIDGVLVSPGTRTVDWRMVAIPGSDHAAVLVELALPSASAAAPGSGGRGG